MWLLLRSTIKLSQQRPAISLFCLLFLTNRNSSPNSCSSLVSVPSQSCPTICFLSSTVARSIQTSAQLKFQRARSLDLKCDLLHQEGFSPSQVTVLQDNPYFRSASFEKVSSVICFLRSKGIVGAVAGRILTRNPRMLEHKVESMERTCKFFEDLGIEPLGLQSLLSKAHTRYVLRRGTDGLQKRFDFLQRIGLKKEDILKIIITFSNILFVSVERKMEPTLAFFERHGMSKEFFGRLVRLHPQVFGYSIDGSLTEKLEFVRRLGLSTDSKNGARAFQCWITLKPKVLLSKWECLKRQGFSETEVLKMVSLHPDILSRKEDSLKCKIDYCKNVLNLDVQELAKYPAYFTHSLENRIIPRFSFLNELMEKGKRSKALALSSVIIPSDKVFERKYGPGYGKWKARYADGKKADV